MKTPTELNVTRRPKAECATIWKNNQKTIETAEIRRNMANIDALCLLRHTGTETIDAMNAVASAVRKTEAAPRIEMLSGPHKDPYTIAGALYTDVILNPNLDDETADVLYRTIVETAVTLFAQRPGCIISWNPSDTVTAELMNPYTQDPIGPYTPSVH